MNLMIYIFILVISIFSIYLSKKISAKLGITIVFITSSFLSLILSFKYIMLSTININANAITYITMFTSLYILLESTNKEEIKKIVNLNFLLSVFTSLILYLMSYHGQSVNDTISVNMKNVFINNDRILVIYPITSLLSNYLLIWMYKKIRNLYDTPFITTVTTYLLIGLIESILYFFLAYFKILHIKIIIKLLLSTYMAKLIITIIHSIFLTLLTKKKVKK